jgi:hypothetical protein
MSATIEPNPPEKAPTSGPISMAVMYTITSPILKYPRVAGTYTLKTMVAAAMKAVKIAALAIVVLLVFIQLIDKTDW